MEQVFNFSAGPSALPSQVLNKIQRDLLEFGNAKASAIEISHRGGFYGVGEKGRAEFKRFNGDS